MALRKLNPHRHQQQVEEANRLRADLVGWSPGAAAAELGITRQAVHAAIRRGDLDANEVKDLETGMKLYFIPDASLRRFAKARADRDV
jgi:hypothetical protein